MVSRPGGRESAIYSLQYDVLKHFEPTSLIAGIPFVMARKKPRMAKKLKPQQEREVIPYRQNFNLTSEPISLSV
jgi:hypothetical protein